jgi:hypothetical protein
MAGYSDFTNTIGEIEGIEHLNSAFDPTVGHDHSGATGMGKKISPTNIDEIVDQTLVGGSNTGNIHQILCWIVKKIKEITGKTNWYDSGGAGTATLANAAKGDKRFWFSGNVGKDIVVNAGSSVQIYQNFIDADAALKIKRVRNVFSNNFVINISTSGSGGSNYQSTSVITDYNLDHLLCNAGNIMLSIKAVNVSGSQQTLSFDSGWYVELAIE